jgi:hypothetical protein
VLKGLGLTGTGLFDPGLYLIWAIRSRSDGGQRPRRRWRGGWQRTAAGLLGTARRGPEWAAHGEAWQGGDGEQLPRREGERKRGSRPARILTPRQNSSDGSW